MTLPSDRTETATLPEVVLRTPTAQDAAAIWKLVADCPTLDSNSCYAYLLLCSDFADTCVVAYAGESLAGFVAGYVPPRRPDAVFVWQVGVAAEARGQGLGLRLLRELVARHGSSVRYLEATVTPGNRASWRLFESLARELGCPLQSRPQFSAQHFADEVHEAEVLIRIGPITPE